MQAKQNLITAAKMRFQVQGKVKGFELGYFELGFELGDVECMKIWFR